MLANQRFAQLMQFFADRNFVAVGIEKSQRPLGKLLQLCRTVIGKFIEPG